MSVVLVALATSMLSGCGADDATPAPTSSSTTDSHGQAAQPLASIPAPSAAPLDAAASSALAANPAAASDPIAQNRQANLAADNQQITPVMHYAPGDSANSN